MKITLNIILLFTLFQSTAQNLVPNPSFEFFISPPDFLSELDKATPWFSPNYASPDLFCTCSTNLGTAPSNVFGTELPHSGQSYAGLSTFEIQDWREYISVQLLDTLEFGIKYWASFYVSLADNSKYSMNKIGAFFSGNQFQQTTTSTIIASPQILNDSTNSLSNKNGWTLIKSSFIASGGEKYINIGNFFSQSQTDTIFVGAAVIPDTIAYFYIDDICVSTDSLTCAGNVGLEELSSQNKKLVQIVDIMGRETDDKPNTLLIYVYSDGTKEKVFRIE